MEIIKYVKLKLKLNFNKINGNNISPTKMEAKKGKEWAEIPLDEGSPK